jgi:hypothetical protein
LEGLDRFYRPASIISDQRAVRGIISALFEVGDCGCGQSVGVLRGNEACSDASTRLLILDDQWSGFAGVFRTSQDAELCEL